MFSPNYILAVAFAVFAILQFNDPDPWQWILIYGAVAMLSLSTVGGQYRRQLLLAAALSCILGALYYSPAVVDWLSNYQLSDIVQEMSPEKPFIEEARECGGLLIAAGALTWLYRDHRKSS